MPPHLAALAFASVFLLNSASILLAAGAYPVQGNVIENPGDEEPRGMFYELNDGSMEYDPVYPRMSVYDVATAHAGADGLYVSTHSEIDGGTGGGYDGISGQETFAYAWATWDDFVISGPSGSAPITASFNVHLDSPQPLLANQPDPYLLASTEIEVGFAVQDNEIGEGFFADATGDIVPSIPAPGMLAGFDGNSDLTTPTFVVPVNTPFSVKFWLYATATVLGDSTSLANADYRLTFATDETVLNLPDS
ncbi:MAG TPA: hypothetical protein VGG19_13990 [Tepidisphaeraceae bacterium]|jgi:hypothetical protein